MSISITYTLTGSNFCLDQSLVVDFVFKNKSSESVVAGNFVYQGNTQFKKASAPVPAIPAGGEVRITLVLENCSSRIEDIARCEPYTYTAGSQVFSGSFFNPIYLYTDDVCACRPLCPVMVNGELQIKPNLVLLMLGEAGCGKSSWWVSIATLMTQCLSDPWDYVYNVTQAGGSGEHCTQNIQSFTLDRPGEGQGRNLRVKGVDGWGVDSSTWPGESILLLAQGYLRQDCKMTDPLAVNLTEEVKSLLEPTRKLHEADVIALTISADSLLSDNLGPKNKLKEQGAILKKAGYPVIVVVTKVDLLMKPDGSTLVEDTESPASKATARSLIAAASDHFRVPEEMVQLNINYDGLAKNTKDQRWNLDRMHLKTLSCLMKAAESRDRRELQRTLLRAGNMADGQCVTQ